MNRSWVLIGIVAVGLIAVLIPVYFNNSRPVGNNSPMNDIANLPNEADAIPSNVSDSHEASQNTSNTGTMDNLQSNNGSQSSQTPIIAKNTDTGSNDDQLVSNSTSSSANATTSVSSPEPQPANNNLQTGGGGGGGGSSGSSGGGGGGNGGSPGVVDVHANVLELEGDNFYDVPSDSSLQLTTFTVGAWFKTTEDFSSRAFIVNKGGLGGNAPGENLNYGIWMLSDASLRGGFETPTGRAWLVSSNIPYNDGQWHYAVLTYDGSNLKLYVDGTLASSIDSQGATPDNTGNQPFRVGANSATWNGLNSLFTGEIDEIRFWSFALGSDEIHNQYLNGKYSNSGLILYLPFNPDNAPIARDMYISTDINTPRTFKLIASDEDGQSLTFKITTQPGHGTLTMSGRSVTYTPAPGFVGTDNFTFKASDGDQLSNTAQAFVRVLASPAYSYSPGIVLTGSDDCPLTVCSVQSDSSLQLSRFTVAAWFKTSSTFDTNAFIVDKGGLGTDATSVRNLNYGIWMTASGRVQGGFETQTGASNFVTTPNEYNDGRWHYAVLTYDGDALRMYIDGTEVNFVEEHSAPLSTTDKPLRVGSNALVSSNFFSGEIDEVRVWDHTIAPTEVADQYNDKVFVSTGLALYLPFS